MITKYTRRLLNKWLRLLPDRKTGIWWDGKMYSGAASEHLSKYGLKCRRLERLSRKQFDAFVSACEQDREPSEKIKQAAKRLDEEGY